MFWPVWEVQLNRRGNYINKDKLVRTSTTWLQKQAQLEIDKWNKLTNNKYKKMQAESEKWNCSNIFISGPKHRNRKHIQRINVSDGPFTK